MPLPYDRDKLTPGTRAYKEKIDNYRLSPRVKMALRMYAYGSCRTLTEAAEAMDLDVGYLSSVRNSVPGAAFMESAEAIIADRTLEGHELLNKLGRRALEITARLMETSANENVQLKAAIDLSDRSPTYSAVQKMQVESFTLSGRDAKLIAESLVRGENVHEKFKELSSGNFDRVELTDEPHSNSPIDDPLGGNEVG